MGADHVRQRTQSDWRYWVFTSIMGHFVHSFAQDVSNISPQEMQSSSIDWLGERMSLQQLRKDAFRKLAKLCSKTSIMEDPSKLPEEARSFVALNDPDPPESKAERESYGRKFWSPSLRVCKHTLNSSESERSDIRLFEKCNNIDACWHRYSAKQIFVYV